MAIPIAKESVTVIPRSLIMQHLAVGISFANLCFLRRWKELLTYTPRDMYFMSLPPSPQQYYAVIFNVFLLGAVFSCLHYLVCKAGSGRFSKIARIGYLILLVIPLNALRDALSGYFPYLRGPLIRLLGETTALGLFALGGGLLLLVVVLWPLRAFAVATTVLAVLAPFAAVTITEAMWGASRYNAGPFLNRPVAPPAPAVKALDARVVWMIFDEMDQRLAFDERRKDLQLPELDRLRQMGVYASQAFPPSGSTLTSLPSLIGGRPVKNAEPEGPGQLSIRYLDSKNFVNWADQPNVFRRARAMGLNVALAGWYHPYCRVLASDVTYCASEPIELLTNTVGRTFRVAAVDQLRGLFETSLYSPFGQSLATEARVRRETRLVEWSKSVAADPSVGLAFLHLQPSHTPFTYNRRTGALNLSNSGVHGYIDALAQVDRIFGQIRRALEKAGLWDRTSVLVTSDHWYRSSTVLDGKMDHRVPFLVKLAGQNSAVTYNQPFSTVLSQELVQNILRKEIRTHQDVVRFLDSHRQQWPAHPF